MFKFKSTVGMTRNLYILVMSHEKPNTYETIILLLRTLARVVEYLSN